MSLDAAFQEALRPLRDEIETLKHRLDAAERNLKRPVYDAKQLHQELGFSQHEAYSVLRAHGVVINGRRRISAVDLIRVFSREDHSDYSAPSGAHAATRSASAQN